MTFSTKTVDAHQETAEPKSVTEVQRALVLNMATSAAGSIRVEIQDRLGKPLPGFSLDDADELIGDQIERVVRWRGKADLSALVSTPVRLRFVLQDADLYSLQIR